MAMQHKPTRTRKKYQPPKAKRRGAGEHHVMLTEEQITALSQWQNDFKKMMPHIVGAAETAQRVFEEVIGAPQWHISETPRPERLSEQDEPKLWTVGHAKVNITDERKGDSA